MANKTFIVTNDFMDKETGETVTTGSLFEADADREKLLRAADVIGKEVPSEEKPVQTLTDPDKDTKADKKAAVDKKAADAGKE